MAVGRHLRVAFQTLLAEQRPGLAMLSERDDSDISSPCPGARHAYEQLAWPRHRHGHVVVRTGKLLALGTGAIGGDREDPECAALAVRCEEYADAVKAPRRREILSRPLRDSRDHLAVEVPHPNVAVSAAHIQRHSCPVRRNPGVDILHRRGRNRFHAAFTVHPRHRAQLRSRRRQVGERAVARHVEVRVESSHRLVGRHAFHSDRHTTSAEALRVECHGLKPPPAAIQQMSARYIACCVTTLQKCLLLSSGDIDQCDSSFGRPTTSQNSEQHGSSIRQELRPCVAHFPGRRVWRGNDLCLTVLGADA
jgi:hypothetical protein